MNGHLNPLVDFDYFIYADSAVADNQAKQELGIDKEWEKEHGKEAVQERLAKHDYVRYALANVKNSYNKILDHFPSRSYVQLHLGGPINYRDSLGTIKIYKGQRKKSSRPKYYKEAREYMIERHGAILSDGREADDDVSIAQFSKPDKSTCIVSVDKDLLNTPGWHLSPKTWEMKYVTKKEADANFWTQVATGDDCDYIQGIKGFGKKGGEKLYARHNGDALAIRKEVEQMFRASYGKEWEAALHETAALVWIQRQDWINYDGSRIEKPIAPPTTEDTADDQEDPA